MAIKLGILGWPLEKTFSPKIQTYLGKYTGVKLEYEKIHYENITLENINKINRNFLGYNVTIPHKSSVFNLLSKLENVDFDETAVNTKVVNTVKSSKDRIFVANTDLVGIEQTFKYIDYSLVNKKVLILGNGSSSKTLTSFLNNRGIVYIASRNDEENTISYEEVKNIAHEINLIINTTPLGMPPYEKEKLPLDINLFKNLELFFNLGYGLSKNWVNGITLNKVEYVDGLIMLIGQAIESFNIWTDKNINFDEVYERILNEVINEN